MSPITALSSAVLINPVVTDRSVSPASPGQTSGGASASVIIDISSNADGQSPKDDQTPAPSEVSNLMTLFGTNVFAFAAYDPKAYNNAMVLLSNSSAGSTADSDSDLISLYSKVTG